LFVVEYSNSPGSVSEGRIFALDNSPEPWKGAGFKPDEIILVSEFYHSDAQQATRILQVAADKKAVFLSYVLGPFPVCQSAFLIVASNLCFRREQDFLAY